MDVVILWSTAVGKYSQYQIMLENIFSSSWLVFHKGKLNIGNQRIVCSSYTFMTGVSSLEAEISL